MTARFGGVIFPSFLTSQSPEAPVSDIGGLFCSLFTVRSLSPKARIASSALISPLFSRSSTSAREGEGLVSMNSELAGDPVKPGLDRRITDPKYLFHFLDGPVGAQEGGYEDVVSRPTGPAGRVNAPSTVICFSATRTRSMTRGPPGRSAAAPASRKRASDRIPSGFVLFQDI